MAINRSTYHESWYRIAPLHPKLLSSVHIYKQCFRGQDWYVLENPANNKFFRVSPSAYHFIGLLDGNRTVSDVWTLCNRDLADQAPTQGEILQLLVQLYSTNILSAELSPDTRGLFNRYRKRIMSYYIYIYIYY